MHLPHVLAIQLAEHPVVQPAEGLERQVPLTRREADARELESRVRDSRLRLGAAANGASLCMIRGPGQDSRRPVKYLEGAAASLSEVQRTLCRAASETPADASVLDAVEVVLARGAAERLTRARSGPTWADYLAGGIHGVQDLRNALEASRLGSPIRVGESSAQTRT